MGSRRDLVHAWAQSQNNEPLLPSDDQLEPVQSRTAAASGALNAAVHLLHELNGPSSGHNGEPSLPAPATISPPTNVATDPMSSAAPATRRKLCFVTVGATAPFDRLIEAVQTPQFLSVLESAGFTNLLIQHGHKAEARPTEDVGSIRITSFDFRRDGIAREIASAKGDIRKAKAEVKGSKTNLEGLDFGEGWQEATWEEGVVISHAGSGSILDALRVSVPLVVVPNEGLLDNHQIDLARELAKQGYVVHGRLDKLTDALAKIEQQRSKRKQWPPASDGRGKSSHGLIGIMDEEMGYTDLKSQTGTSRLHLD